MSDTLNITDLKNFLQTFANERDWNKYHHPKNLAMALSVEASELVEIFQWLNEQESLQAGNNAEIKTKTSHELADIIIYAIRMAGIMNINLQEAIQTKLQINKTKYPATPINLLNPDVST